MSLTPATYNIACYQGATLDKTFTCTNNGTAVNWTGYTAKMQVRQYVNLADAAVLTLTTGSGIATLTSDGKVTITITAAQTGAIPQGNYVYDLELTSGATVTRLLQGRFSVDGQVTA
jgi:hypothetical protein